MQYLSSFPIADPVTVPSSHPLTDLSDTPSEAQLVPAHNRTKPTILLAEDDEDLLELTRAFLKATGYAVLTCSNGRIAAEVFRKAPHVDLLLTDLRMPEISGLELARDLTYLQPSLPVLMISGALIEDEIEAEMNRRGWQFLAKPWTFPNLLTAVHSMLGDLAWEPDESFPE